MRRSQRDKKCKKRKMIDVKVDTEHTEEDGAASDGEDDDVTEGYQPAKKFDSVKKRGWQCFLYFIDKYNQ